MLTGSFIKGRLKISGIRNPCKIAVIYDLGSLNLVYMIILIESYGMCHCKVRSIDITILINIKTYRCSCHFRSVCFSPYPLVEVGCGGRIGEFQHGCRDRLKPLYAGISGIKELCFGYILIEGNGNIGHAYPVNMVTAGA